MEVLQNFSNATTNAEKQDVDDTNPQECEKLFSPIVLKYLSAESLF